MVCNRFFKTNRINCIIESTLRNIFTDIGSERNAITDFDGNVFEMQSSVRQTHEWPHICWFRSSFALLRTGLGILCQCCGAVRGQYFTSRPSDQMRRHSIEFSLDVCTDDSSRRLICRSIARNTPIRQILRIYCSVITKTPKRRQFIWFYVPFANYNSKIYIWLNSCLSNDIETKRFVNLWREQRYLTYNRHLVLLSSINLINSSDKRHALSLDVDKENRFWLKI